MPPTLPAGTRKLEIFARNHNRRPGWTSLGNQLDGTVLVDEDAKGGPGGRLCPQHPLPGCMCWLAARLQDGAPRRSWNAMCCCRCCLPAAAARYLARYRYMGGHEDEEKQGQAPPMHPQDRGPGPPHMGGGGPPYMQPPYNPW